VLQQIPLAVIELPLSFVIFPPEVADNEVMLLIFVVVNTGTTAVNTVTSFV
jgi:hypothetical protein